MRTDSWDMEDILAAIDALSIGNGHQDSGAISPVDLAKGMALWIEYIEELTFGKIKAWHHASNLPFEGNYHEREIHGLLKVGSGAGMIFVNSSDTDSQQQFTIAHELAHFIIEQEMVLKRISLAMGEETADQWMNGNKPSREDRLKGILLGLEFKPQFHLLAKENMHPLESNEISMAEWNADCLAFEMLAPMRSLIPLVRSRSYSETRTKAQSTLCKQYKFPVREAAAYAELIADKIHGGKTIWEFLGR